MKYEVYRGSLCLKDYLFFATTERGKVYETGEFVHNYALAYAFKLAAGPYSHEIHEPHYKDELQPLNDRSLYITPAKLLSSPTFRLNQFNTLKEGYGFGKKDRSIGYPDWGYLRLIPPEAEFVFYVLCPDKSCFAEGKSEEETIWFRFFALLGHGKFYVRLGKFMSKALVRITPAIETKLEEGKPFFSEALLNWRDVHYQPLFFDMIGNALPTKLLFNAHFQGGKSIKAIFAENQEVVLPAEMSFLHRLP